MKIFSSYESYKALFADIASQVTYSQKSGLYIKHFGDLDFARVHRIKNEKLKEAILGSEEFLSEERKLSLLKEHGLWSDKEEDDLLSLDLTITDNKKNASTIVIPNQRKFIEGIIEKKEKERSELLAKKESLMGETKERYSSIFLSESLIQHSFFKDEKCSIPAFPEDVYDALTDDEIAKLNSEYSEFLSTFNSRAIRLLAVLPFVLNLLGHCRKRPYDFFGIPIVKLSHFQAELLSKGFRNLAVLDSAEGEPPDILEHTEEQEVLDWYDSNYSILVGKNKNGGQSGTTTSKKYVPTKS
jgi:hypothetical protein